MTSSLQLIAHLFSFRSDNSADIKDWVGLVVLHQEDEGMIHVEEFRVPQLSRAKDVGVERISINIQLQGRSVEDVGEVEVLLSRNVGQVRLGFVYGFS